VPPPIPTPTPSPPAQTAYLAGAGDIADCSAGADGGSHAEATAKLLDLLPEAFVFTMGDNAYFDGSAADYNNCYRPRWGRHLFRTYPSAGNHDGYDSGLGGNPYFDYFGGAKQGAGDRGAGYYSFTLGNWHIIALNSNVQSSAGSAQYAWLNNDLRNNTAKCTLAYWHHPLFTSGPSAGSNAMMRDVWTLLYGQNVDVVVNGHDHFYERFFPQDANGIRGSTGGITEYIVGTGGTSLYDFSLPLPNSAAKIKNWGVLYLTLRATDWDSVFIEAGTGNRLDFSTSACH
jgi:hypothetical protein